MRVLILYNIARQLRKGTAADLSCEAEIEIIAPIVRDIMDGKGAWRDNVFVERLWKSVKYEEVYLRAYETVGEARSSIGRYLDFYNGRRPHSSLDDRTPDQAYFDLPPLRAAA